MNHINRNRIEELIGKFSSVQAPIVIGDVGIDKYTLGVVKRISPEAPVPVVEVKKEWPVLGLGANVAHNLATLGSNCLLCGVIGDDHRADILEKMIRDLKLSSDGLIRDDQRSTIFKERVTTTIQQICRIDYETNINIDEKLEKELLKKVDHYKSNFGPLIIQDYGKGGVTQNLVNGLVEIYQSSKEKIFVDPSRWTPGHFYQGVDYIKPNWEESKILCESLGYKMAMKPENMAPFLLDKLELEGVIITQGGEGLSLYTKESQNLVVIPTMAQEVFDVSGAGDTVLSSFVLAMEAGATFEEAAWVSNCAAGVVVGKKGTATVTIGEIIDYYDKSIQSQKLS